MPKTSSIFTGINAQDRKHAKKMTQPLFMPLELATLTNEYFSHDDWIYEEKYDGERCQVVKKKGKVHLVSRNRKSMNEQYPELVEAFEKQSADNFIVDGEIVAMGKKGSGDFQMLQSRIHLTRKQMIETRVKQVPIKICIFDILYAGGYDLRQMPLLARKKVLKNLLSFNKKIEFAKHKVGKGIPFFKAACKMHWEGIMAKYSQSKYTGKRSTDWLKFKCFMQQELVIAGYTDPQRSREYFGSLLVGYYKNKKLMYAGKVGTGYTHEVLKNLGTRMKKLEIKTCPFENYDESVKGVHWIKPELVAEFEFANWTLGGKLRVGRYKGLRDDKQARDVVKEIPKRISIRK